MKTAKQHNSDQCGEAWTAHMMGGSSAAEQALESLFKALGAKMVQVCSECCQPTGGEAWKVWGKDGRYCTYCARKLCRETADKIADVKRSKTKSKRASRSRRAA